MEYNNVKQITPISAYGEETIGDSIPGACILYPATSSDTRYGLIDVHVLIKKHALFYLC